MLATKPGPVGQSISARQTALTWTPVEPDRKNNQLASPRRIRDWNTEFEPRKIPPENILLESESLPAKARNFSPSAGILRSYYNRKSSAEETTLQLYHGNISVGKAEEIAA